MTDERLLDRGPGPASSPCATPAAGWGEGEEGRRHVGPGRAAGRRPRRRMVRLAGPALPAPEGRTPRGRGLRDERDHRRRRPTVTIGCAPVAPTIDGSFDDWRSVAEHDADAAVFGAGQRRAGLTATWQALWDTDALYVHAVVVDPVVTPTRDPRRSGGTVTPSRSRSAPTPGRWLGPRRCARDRTST